MPECLFCSIVAGDVHASLVRAGTHAVAFRNINPQAPVHVLVIPREHHENLAALAASGDGLLDELAAEADLVAQADGVAGSGYRVVFNTGPHGGQTVGHVHAHVLGGRAMAWPPRMSRPRPRR